MLSNSAGTKGTFSTHPQNIGLSSGKAVNGGDHGGKRRTRAESISLSSFSFTPKAETLMTSNPGSQGSTSFLNFENASCIDYSLQSKTSYNEKSAINARPVRRAIGAAGHFGTDYLRLK